MTGYDSLLRWVFATAIAGGPLGYLVGGALAPAVHLSGEATIAANAAANPTTNIVHLAAFVIASFLLPLGAIGLTLLLYRRSPRLATIAGLLGVVGWLPFSALAALDDLAYVMAMSPQSTSHGVLLELFTTDAVMTIYLMVYILFHLVAYILFGVALLRTHVVPAWSAWAMIASSPVTVAAFVLPGDMETVGVAVGVIALSLLVLGSLPAAAGMIRGAAVFSTLPQESGAEE